MDLLRSNDRIVRPLGDATIRKFFDIHSVKDSESTELQFSAKATISNIGIAGRLRDLNEYALNPTATKGID